MNLEKTLEALRNSQVEFVLIGGAAMAVQGSAYVTRDLDFCYARTGKNMKQLAAALSPFHVKLRGAPGNLPFRFDAETIARGLNFTLMTDLGEIDLLGEDGWPWGLREGKSRVGETGNLWSRMPCAFPFGFDQVEAGCREAKRLDGIAGIGSVERAARKNG